MENLETYIAFDLEFNTIDGVSHIIQVSAVKLNQHEEVDQFDSFVYSDVPLQSFINGLTGITADKIAKAPKSRVCSWQILNHLLVTLHLSATMLLNQIYLF